MYFMIFSTGFICKFLILRGIQRVITNIYIVIRVMYRLLLPEFNEINFLFIIS